MKQHVKDELAGAGLAAVMMALVWLLLAMGGCSPALPNAPNARPTVRMAEPLSHTNVRTFQPGYLASITVLPPSDQQFDITATVYMRLAWSAPRDQYRWEGRTCTQIGNIKLGTAGECCPETGGGIIAAIVTPDSVTIWGNIGTYYPAELDYYTIETRVGLLQVFTATPPIYRLSPLIYSGTLDGCRVTGGYASDKGEMGVSQPDAGLLVRDVP